MTLPSRFGLIGDVHAAAENLAVAIRHLRAEGVDRLLCVGDLVDGEGDLERCVELLRDADVATVRGNHERWLLNDYMRDLPDAHLRFDLSQWVVEYLDRLPVTRSFATTSGDLLLSHGVGDDDMFFLRPDIGEYDIRMSDDIDDIVQSGVRWAVGGHTHQPMDLAIRGVRFINPGPTADAPVGSCALLDVESGVVQTWPLADL